MEDVSYQNLFSIVQPTLPENWQETIIVAAFIGKVCEIKYFVRMGQGCYLDCFHLNILNVTLLNAIEALHREIAPVRNALDEENRWNSITVRIYSDGHFTSDFDYSDDYATPGTFFDAWTQRNLV